MNLLQNLADDNNNNINNIKNIKNLITETPFPKVDFIQNLFKPKKKIKPEKEEKSNEDIKYNKDKFYKLDNSMLPLKTNKNDNAGNNKEINEVENLKILYDNHIISNFIINCTIPKEKNGNLDIDLINSIQNVNNINKGSKHKENKIIQNKKARTKSNLKVISFENQV